MLQAVATLALEFVSGKKRAAPRALLETAAYLHGIVLSLQGLQGIALQNVIAKVGRREVGRGRTGGRDVRSMARKINERPRRGGEGGGQVRSGKGGTVCQSYPTQSPFNPFNSEKATPFPLISSSLCLRNGGCTFQGGYAPHPGASGVYTIQGTGAARLYRLLTTTLPHPPCSTRQGRLNSRVPIAYKVRYLPPPTQLPRAFPCA